MTIKTFLRIIRNRQKHKVISIINKLDWHSVKRWAKRDISEIDCVVIHHTNICCLSVAGSRPSRKQIASLRWLIKELLESFQVQMDSVLSHNEIADTNCPGEYIAALIKQIGK
jgi:hypothetical protein